MKLCIGKITVLFMALFLSLSTIFATTNTMTNGANNNSMMNSIRNGINDTRNAIDDAITGDDNMTNNNSTYNNGTYYNDNYNNYNSYSNYNNGTNGTNRSTGNMFMSDRYANNYNSNGTVAESNALRNERTFDWITVGIAVAAIATVLGVSYKLITPDTDRM